MKPSPGIHKQTQTCPQGPTLASASLSELASLFSASTAFWYSPTFLCLKGFAHFASSSANAFLWDFQMTFFSPLRSQLKRIRSLKSPYLALPVQTVPQSSLSVTAQHITLFYSLQSTSYYLKQILYIFLIYFSPVNGYFIVLKFIYFNWVNYNIVVVYL